MARHIFTMPPSEQFVRGGHGERRHRLPTFTSSARRSVGGPSVLFRDLFPRGAQYKTRRHYNCPYGNKNKCVNSGVNPKNRGCGGQSSMSWAHPRPSSPSPCHHLAPMSTTVAAFGPQNDQCYVMAIASRYVARPNPTPRRPPPKSLQPRRSPNLTAPPPSPRPTARTVNT